MSPLQPPGSPRVLALIPCGGTGSRAGQGLPKQYRAVAGRPVLAHTLTALAAVAALDATLVVIAPDDTHFGALREGLPHAGFAALAPAGWLSVAPCAGDTRARTVFNGLNWLQAHGAQPHDWVLVHDAARCLVRPAQVQALIAACQDDPVGGLLALPLPDTLKAEVDGRVQATVARGDKWLAQTPQMFRLGVLQQALALAAQRGFEGITDESSALEAQGLRPRLVPGSAQNFKLTYPDDFALADAILRSHNA